MTPLESPSLLLPEDLVVERHNYWMVSYRLLRIIAYWLLYPLGIDDIIVLKKVKAQRPMYTKDRLTIAYLISRECIVADYENDTLSVTKIGEDGLEYGYMEKKIPVRKRQINLTRHKH